ncbi:unnamed protein product [Echinostoma caproni]|uniref:Uncharacterized protein n=1 Tax=Echinostoma caproni TaxID=27848 RepID=A0A183AFM2_9TREM|nr:unnamed protein product [Echinostoma caproni]
MFLALPSSLDLAQTSTYRSPSFVPTLMPKRFRSRNTTTTAMLSPRSRSCNWHRSDSTQLQSDIVRLPDLTPTESGYQARGLSLAKLTGRTNKRWERSKTIQVKWQNFIGQLDLEYSPHPPPPSPVCKSRISRLSQGNPSVVSFPCGQMEMHWKVPDHGDGSGDCE